MLNYFRRGIIAALGFFTLSSREGANEWPACGKQATIRLHPRTDGDVSLKPTRQRVLLLRRVGRWWRAFTGTRGFVVFRQLMAFTVDGFCK